MDYISKLPQEMLELILCRLPIQDAARTSVLSKEWRYIWTTIPNLVFDENTFHVSDDGDDLSLSEEDQESQRKSICSCKLFFAIFRVLFTRSGGIHEFSLLMKASEDEESQRKRIYSAIDVILHRLSLQNTLKKLTLKCSPGYELPSSFFIMNQLTDLYLSGCEIDVKPTLSGFSRLTSLFLEELLIPDEELINFLSLSPLLKTVTINIGLDHITYTAYATITNLFECFPLIENLSVVYDLLECFSEDAIPQKLHIALVYLKYFCVECMCFTKDSYQHILVPVINSAPNLEKLKVEMDHRCFSDKSSGWFILEDYSNIQFEHLRELDIINVSNRENGELDFVKLILAKSPVLKNIRIFLYIGVQIKETLRILSHFPRASSVVKVTVTRHQR